MTAHEATNKLNTMDEQKTIPSGTPEEMETKAPTPAAPVTPETTDEEKTEEVQEAAEPLKGRAALLDRYKKANEGVTEDPDDDTLADYAIGALNERDDYKGRYEKFNESNQKLIEAIRENPPVAEFIARISRGEDPMKAIGQSFGDLRDMIDEESVRKIDEGAKERQSRYDEVKGNFETYAKTLDKYAKDNGLAEEEKDEIHNAIIGFATDLSEGRIDEGTIDFFHKALTYDEEKQADLNAATLAGRNAAIDDIKNRQEAKQEAMPDVTADRSLPHKEESFYYEPKTTNIADQLQDKE